MPNGRLHATQNLKKPKCQLCEVIMDPKSYCETVNHELTAWKAKI